MGRVEKGAIVRRKEAHPCSEPLRRYTYYSPKDTLRDYAEVLAEIAHAVQCNNENL